VFGVFLGLWIGLNLGRTGFSPLGSSPNYRLISQAWNRIQGYYVDRAALKASSITYGAIDGMMNALGDTGHSTFLSPEMVKGLAQSERGRYKGIGVEIEMKGGQVVVVAPIDDSPAQRAGLRSGDIILKVDGQSITDLPVNQVIARITGLPGTSVTLTILDPKTGHMREIAVERASIQLHTVTWRKLPGVSVAHLRLSAFEEGTSDELSKSLAEIQKDHLSGIILDLRSNPGGILEQAVTAASQFLAGGKVLEIKDAGGHVVPVPAEPGGLATNIPMVVLINGGTASGAEIVAGAMRDDKRGPLIGETTFGTGTVLQEFPLYDGSALLLAVQEWLTPDGESFWHKGIAPTIKVSLPPDKHILLPAAEEGMTAEQLNSSGDTQLLRGVAALSGDSPH